MSLLLSEEQCEPAGRNDAELRVLGLPENCTYNHGDLQRAKAHELALSFFAIDHLVTVYTSPVLKSGVL